MPVNYSTISEFFDVFLMFVFNAVLIGEISFIAIASLITALFYTWCMEHSLWMAFPTWILILDSQIAPSDK